MKYSLEFYRNLKVGQIIYKIDFRDKISKHEIKSIEFSETIDKDGPKIEFFRIYADDSGNHSRNIEFDNSSPIYLNEQDILQNIFGASASSTFDCIRLEKALHSLRAHPDYEYETTEGPRKNWNQNPPEGNGWENNKDYHDGFERFDYHEEAYWRRKQIQEI